MLLLFLVGTGPSSPAPPVTSADRYLFGAATAQAALSRDTDPAETSSTLSTLTNGFENHQRPLSTDI